MHKSSNLRVFIIFIKMNNIWRVKFMKTLCHYLPVHVFCAFIVPIHAEK